MRILIAEDDVVSRHVLEATLLKWGHEVITTKSGAEAWQAVQAEDAPHLAVLDWMMPELDGPDICRRIRTMPGGEYFYILLLTAKSQIEDVVEGLDAGADDYIVKPFDKRELRMRIGCGQRIITLQEELLATRDQLAHQATHDPLTGLNNRAAIFDALAREWSRSQRDEKPMAVVMADLDYFKIVNDEHGHAAGDIVLQQTALRMRNACRGYDMVGRYGGEEFIVVLAASTNSAEASVLASRIRKLIGGTPFALPDGTELRVTASLGVAATDRLDVDSIDQLVNAADKALYEAKHQGRDAVLIAIRDTIVRHE